MAGLAIGIAMASAASFAAASYAITHVNDVDDEDYVTLPDGKKVSPGAIVKLKDEALAKYEGKGLTKPGSDHTGNVEAINADAVPVTIEVSNTVKNRVETGKYDPADFVLITPAIKFHGDRIRIQGGIARKDVRVRLFKKQGIDSTGNGKALGNPFYNSIGTVVSVDLKAKTVKVQASAVKIPSIKWTQDYLATDLEFVSLPQITVTPGFPTESGYINVGTRVSLNSESIAKAKKGEAPFNTLFLAVEKDYETEGVVTNLRISKDGKKVATVKCKKLNTTEYYDQDYDVSILRPLRASGIPTGGVPIFGGLADRGIKVKLREEKKDEFPNKCLSRPTFGYTGVVDEVDMDATDGLNVLVRCAGSNDGEEASDWYNGDALELVDLPIGEGIPIFGGVATVGSLVEVTVDARGVKCLGKPNIGNIGIVMGIDPNAPDGEVLNIRCGRDQRTNSKVTNWYNPKDVKKYFKMSEEGSEIDRIRAQLDLERIKLKSAQSRKDAGEETSATAKIAELEAKLKELEGEGQSREKNTEEYNRAKEELAKTRQLIASLEEQYQQASMETTCSPEGLNVETQIKQNAQAILDEFYRIGPFRFPELYKHFDLSFSQGNLSEKENAKKLADDAVEEYNKDPDNDTLKENAKKLVDAYNVIKSKVVSSLTSIQKNYVDKREQFRLAIDAVRPAIALLPPEFKRLVDAERKYIDRFKKYAISDNPGGMIVSQSDTSSDYQQYINETNQIIVNYITAKSAFEAYLNGTPNENVKTLYESIEAFKKAYEDVMNEVHGTSTVTEKNIQKLVAQSKEKARDLFEAEEEAEKALLAKAETLEDEQLIDFYRQYIGIEKRVEISDRQNEIRKAQSSQATKGSTTNPGATKPAANTNARPAKGTQPPTGPAAAAAAAAPPDSTGGFVGGAISFEKSDAIERYKVISLAYAKICRNLHKLKMPPASTTSSSPPPPPGLASSSSSGPASAPPLAPASSSSSAPAPAPPLALAPSSSSGPASAPPLALAPASSSSSGPATAPPLALASSSSSGPATAPSTALAPSSSSAPAPAPASATALASSSASATAPPQAAGILEEKVDSFYDPYTKITFKKGDNASCENGYNDREKFKIVEIIKKTFPNGMIAHMLQGATRNEKKGGKTVSITPTYNPTVCVLEPESAPALSPPPAAPAVVSSLAPATAPDSRKSIDLSVRHKILFDLEQKADKAREDYMKASDAGDVEGIRKQATLIARLDEAFAVAKKNIKRSAYSPPAAPVAAAPVLDLSPNSAPAPGPALAPDPAINPVEISASDFDVDYSSFTPSDPNAPAFNPPLPSSPEFPFDPTAPPPRSSRLASAKKVPPPASSSAITPASAPLKPNIYTREQGPSITSRAADFFFGRPAEKARPLASDPFAKSLLSDLGSADTRKVPTTTSSAKVINARDSLKPVGSTPERPRGVTARFDRLDPEIQNMSGTIPTSGPSKILQDLRTRQNDPTLQTEINSFISNRVFGDDGALKRLKGTKFINKLDAPTSNKIRLAVEEELRINYVRSDPEQRSRFLKAIVGTPPTKISLVFDSYITDDPSYLRDARTAEQKLDSIILGILSKLGLAKGGRRTLRQKVKKFGKRRRTIRR